MAYYKVRYSLDVNNEYIYPRGVSGAVWRSVMYHYSDQVMVGETDSKVVADGKEITDLEPNEAAKLEEQYRSSYPGPEALTEALLQLRQSMRIERDRSPQRAKGGKG